MIVRGTTFRNPHDQPLEVIVEPWGEQHQMLPQESIRVVFYSVSDGEPEITVDKNCISIYGWAGADFLVVKNNVCVDQPDLRSVIRRLWRSESVQPSIDHEDSMYQLHSAQDELDCCPYWDEKGRRAALSVVSRVAPLLRSSRQQLIWQFCQHVLFRRGVFLEENRAQKQQFFDAMDKGFEDRYSILDSWHQVPSGGMGGVRI
jgi:hypothetical protein